METANSDNKQKQIQAIQTEIRNTNNSIKIDSLFNEINKLKWKQ